MSVDIDLGGSPGPEQRPPDQTSVILNLLLAVLLFVAAATVLLIAQQRGRLDAMLSPGPTATVKAVASKTATPTARAAGQATAAPTMPAATQAAPTTAPTMPVITVPEATSTMAAPTAVASVPPAMATSTASTGQPAAPAQASTSWYFGEGATVSPFKTMYSILNPGAQPAKVTLTLYPETGTAVEQSMTVAPGVQVSVVANDLLPNGAMGASVVSDQPVYAVRLTLGDRDGTTGQGMELGKTWYFPEGQTDTDFTTWLLVVNPGAVAANLTVTYYPVPEMAPVVKTYTVGPLSRINIAVNADIPSGVMGIKLESDQPVAAEHSIFFDNQKAAYGGPGELPSTTWYVAGANTQDKFVTRIAILNPGTTVAQVKATALGSKQAAVTETYPIQPQSKDDIVLNDLADGQLVSAILQSDNPVVAEVVSYYYSGGESDPIAAYSLPALSAPAKVWYLPETESGSSADSYVMLFNPGTASATIGVTYISGSGDSVTKVFDLAAMGSSTLKVADDAQGKTIVAAIVRSSQPVVAQRVTMLALTVGATGSAGIAGQ